MVMEHSKWDPRVMQKLKHKVIAIQLRSWLSTRLEPYKYYHILRDKVLDLSDQEKIDQKVTSLEKCNLFLDLLLKRDDAFDILIYALRLSEVDGFIIDKLNEALEELLAEAEKEYSGKVTELEDLEYDDLEGLSDLPVPGSFDGPQVPVITKEFTR